MLVWVQIPSSLLFIYMDKIKVYFCVDNHQLEADCNHADWERIKAVSINKAKYEYSKMTKTKYVDCIVRLACYEKKGYKL